MARVWVLVYVHLECAAAVELPSSQPTQFARARCCPSQEEANIREVALSIPPLAIRRECSGIRIALIARLAKAAELDPR